MAVPPPMTGPVTSQRRHPEGRRRVKRGTVVTAIWFVALTAMTLLVLYPLVWVLLASFKPSSEFGLSYGMLAENPTIDNYVKVLEGIGGVPLWRFLVNSLFVAVMSVIGITLSSSMAAYAFARIKFKASGLFFSLMIGTLLLPVHVVLIPQYIIYNKLGLIDTYVPLLLGKFLAAEAFFVFLMVQFIKGLPRDMDEAAKIDGAGHPRVFFSITLPLIKPALVTSSIFAFIWSWNDFLAPLLYLSSPTNYTLPMALRLYNDQSSVSDYGATVAVSMVALLPVLIFFLIFQRFLIQGVATQGLKG
ncbi:carbohydrate ABC transporter permease [Cryobacterium tepidiphilum]|uniref:Carbohydrate ABC transporter permease n=2 Tax=Cryobacterium tepidiphilum TaxID=2486026 RepID=A0A3M8LNM4_9MICO|nr:carbohydrate ABC transporter permease [Cryobacterium tepidiphilum]